MNEKKKFGTIWKVCLMNSISRSFEFRSIILHFIDGLCSWSDWSDCSASCGSGFQTRQKTVSKDREADIRNLESNECQGREETGKRNCFLKPCQGIVCSKLIYLLKKVFFFYSSILTLLKWIKKSKFSHCWFDPCYTCVSTLMFCSTGFSQVFCKNILYIKQHTSVIPILNWPFQS